MSKPKSQGNGDHRTPNLTQLDPPPQDSPMGKFGRLRKTYLKEHRPELYESLLLEGTLNATMRAFDRQAWERMETIQAGLLRKNPLPQTDDTMELTRHRRMITDMAEETVLNEMVYSP